MGRFVQERKTERRMVDFEAEAIAAYDAGKAEATRLERQGSGKFAASALNRARATCIDLFEGAMKAGQPGVAGIVAWYADLGPTFRAKADAADREQNPRLVNCGK